MSSIIYVFNYNLSQSVLMANKKQILKSAFSVKKGRVSRKNNGIRTFTFSFPSKTYIEGKTSQLHLEFEPSRNWVLALERGISGFSNYMYKKFAGGKSGKGVQIKGRIDRGISSFKPTPYRSEFEKAFRNKNKKKKTIF